MLSLRAAVAMPEPTPNLQEILQRAAELGPRDGLAYLKNKCTDDPEMYAQALEQLSSSWPQGLRPEDLEDGFISEEALGRKSGEYIGPYRIVRTLGRGGMGEVYLCERADEQYQKQVAIKLVSSGLLSRQIHNRLRTERQILASLEHPNIARLLDGGTTKEGVPYLVMEYIEGTPIDIYCDRHRLSIPQRLLLFRAVCSAVHAAHRNLIVHRDLKPSNILVTPDGVPKLLDFGIAKLLDTSNSTHTMAVTQADLRVMTPDHASPEQLRGETITTASDVYVLGVLLYNLLCGMPPFEVAGLRLQDLERLVCEQDPAPPSRALKTGPHTLAHPAGNGMTNGVPEAPRMRERHVRHAALSEGRLSRIARDRGVSMARLRRQLSGDLDNIVMMAMRKEPERRYGSVEQLSADIDLYLKGRPVLARKDTLGYRTYKFLQRHSVIVTVAAGFLLLLSGFAVSMYVQAQRIRAERDLASAQHARAEVERNRAERVSDFLVDLFKRSDPSEARGADITAREILERGARRVQMELQQEPQTQATLMDAIGRVYLGLGLPDRAMPLLEQSLALRERLLGSEHPVTATSMRSLGDARFDKGELNEAEKLLREALRIQVAALGETNDSVATTLHSLATLLLARGELEAAAENYRRSLNILVALHGERNPEVTSIKNELAVVLMTRGQYAQAETLYREALAVDRELLGKDHPQVMHQLSSLALVLQMQHKLDAAEPFYLESIALAQQILGPQHPDTVRTTSNYGQFLLLKGDLDQAEKVAREVLALEQQVRGPKHYYVGYDRVNLGAVLYTRGQLDAAESEYRQAIEIYSAALPDNHQYMASALTGLARVYAERGDRMRVSALVDRAVSIWRKELPEDHWQIASSRAVLGRCDTLSKKYDGAEQLLTACYTALEKQRGTNDINTRRVRGWLKQLYEQWGKPADAEKYK